VFNLSEAQGGGNYWSDWTSPDVDPEDGFVDLPYVFSGGQDNLPLVSEVVSETEPPVITEIDYDEADGTTTVAGTADSGAVITIYDENGDVLCETTADENGNWEYVLSGDYEGTVITVTASGPGGESPPVQPPAAPVIGSVDCDESAGTTTVSGTAEPGAAITIYDANGDVLCETTADENGNWQSVLSGDYGDGNIAVTASDEDGNTSPPSQPPPAPVVGSVDYDETAGTTTVSGSAEPNAIITIYDANGDVLCETTADENGYWQCAISGNYEGSSITVTASDEDGNTSPTANIPPVAGAIIAPLDPVQVYTMVEANADFSDPDIDDTHTATWDWGDGSTSEGTVDEINGTVDGSHVYATAGVYTIALVVTDAAGVSDEAIFQYIVVYEPSAGFVTGGGWINSPVRAYTADPSLTGKANFGFVAKYKKGATAPSGQTEFRFHVADLNFHSTEYRWLVVAGARAQFKGSGTINNAGNYGFMLTAIDEDVTGGGGIDKFRIKIWDKATDTIVYDNNLGADDDAVPTTALTHGSIKIHQG
jgi:hypothetical protein